MMARGTIAGLVLLVSCSVASPDDMTGQASVIDGDTLEIHATRIRLWGIDAPDWCAWSSASTFRPGWPKASSLSLATKSPRSNSHSERQPNIVFGHRRSGGFGANEVTQLGKLDSRAKCVGSWEPMKY
jgi:hypothetical protein